MACPLCASDGAKVIYMGFPMRLCMNAGCFALYGFWSWVMDVFPVPTETDYGPQWKFFVYNGPFLPALWAWIRGECEED